jgi:hypothetical protein
MQDQTKTRTKTKKRNKTIYLKEGGDRKDGTHVGATSPSLIRCLHTLLVMKTSCELPWTTPSTMAPRQRRQKNARWLG